MPEHAVAVPNSFVRAFIASLSFFAVSVHRRSPYLYHACSTTTDAMTTDAMTATDAMWLNTLFPPAWVRVCDVKILMIQFWVFDINSNILKRQKTNYLGLQSLFYYFCMKNDDILFYCDSDSKDKFLNVLKNHLMPLVTSLSSTYGR